MPETTTTAQDEVVQICQDLIRIDTSNFGDGSGPGEAEAAAYVETIYQWPAFRRWYQAALQEVQG